MPSDIRCIGGSKLDKAAVRCRWLKDRCSSSSCVSVCTKAFLVVINLVFLITGWVLFAVGVWIHIYRETFAFAALLRDNPTRPVLVVDHVSLLLIAIGGFVVTVSFLGCCGACTESVCFLGFYAFLLIAAIVFQVCVASLAASFKQTFLDSLDASMHYQVTYEYNATAKPSNRTDTAVYQLTTTWDRLQVQLHCCGASGPQNYRHSSWFNHTPFADGTFVPPSCCVLLNDDPSRPQYADESQCQIEAIQSIFSNASTPMDAGADDGLANRPNINSQGCHKALVNWLNRYEYLIGILFIAIILQIVDFVYACILMSWVRKTLANYSWCENDEFQ